MSDPNRALRVASRIHEELSSMLARDVRDPRVAGVSITEVTVTTDLQHARVLIRTLSDADPQTRRSVLAGLASVHGLLKREVGRRLALRRAPEFAFVWDEGPERRHRVDELLAEIRQAERVEPDGD